MMILSNMVNKLELLLINIFSINLFIIIQHSVLLKHLQDFYYSKKFFLTQKIIIFQFGKYYLLKVFVPLLSVNQFKFKLKYIFSIATQKNYYLTI
jgi:hypothetical protein